MLKPEVEIKLDIKFFFLICMHISISKKKIFFYWLRFFFQVYVRVRVRAFISVFEKSKEKFEKKYFFIYFLTDFLNFYLLSTSGRTDTKNNSTKYIYNK